ncbi:MAG: retroviral-like aspartic protease family protein [Chloroflexota bacterium]|nr:retroviral-like aspartic protease family protein [Chloroflexota bacterium]
MYIYDYDSSYFPAVPVAEIGPNKVGAGPEAEMVLIALLDSGADGTIVPVAHLETMDAEYVNSGFMRGVTGGRSSVDIYAVTLRIGAYKLSSVRVVADEQNQETILGRNVLNRFIVTLNGLAGVTEISD